MLIWQKLNERFGIYIWMKIELWTYGIIWCCGRWFIYNIYCKLYKGTAVKRITPKTVAYNNNNISIIRNWISNFNSRYTSYFSNWNKLVWNYWSGHGLDKTSILRWIIIGKNIRKHLGASGNLQPLFAVQIVMSAFLVHYKMKWNKIK